MTVKMQPNKIKCQILNVPFNRIMDVSWIFLYSIYLCTFPLYYSNAYLSVLLFTLLKLPKWIAEGNNEWFNGPRSKGVSKECSSECISNYKTVPGQAIFEAELLNRSTYLISPSFNELVSPFWPMKRPVYFISWS